MIYSCASHVGKIRKNNEDSCMAKVIQLKNDNELGIFAIADGMGGHNKGEVASEIAVKEIIEFIDKNLVVNNEVKIDYLEDILKQAYNHVNSIIYNKSNTDNIYMGMGTTLTIAILYKENVYVANVGDSRCYLLDEEFFTRITKDHSLVEELVRAHAITKEEAKKHPERNKITRAMGTDSMVIVDIFKYSIAKDDKILLCSDGLTSLVEEEQIMDIISDETQLDEIVTNLIDSANEMGGKDNISVIIIKND